MVQYNSIISRCSLLLVFSLIVLTVDEGGARGGIFAINEQQEIQLGQQVAMQVESKMPMLNDPFVERYAANLGYNLVRFSGRPNLNYRFRVTAANQINAFALPGGFVYVNAPLIAAADNESELAGVLAHEISHVVARHSVEQLERAQKYNLGLGLLGAVLGDRRGGLIDMTKLGIQVTANGFFMKYSRKAEREADELGVGNLHAAGYDPSGMITFFEKLQNMRQRQPGLLDTFFSSHPNLNERIENVSRLINSLPSTSQRIKDTEEFQQIKLHLTGSRSSYSLPQSPSVRAPQNNRRVRKF